MKVLHVINGLGTGGAERSLAEMLPLLERHGVRSSVAVLHHRDLGVHGSVVAQGCDVHVLGSHLGRAARELRRLVQRERPAVVHSTLFEADLLARLATPGTGAALLTSLVNTSSHQVRLAADPGLRRHRLVAVQVLDVVTAKARGTRFHAISTAVGEDARRGLRVRSDRLVVVPRGRARARLEPAGEREQVRRAVRAELGVPPGSRLLLTVGRQEFQKGHRRLVDALPTLPGDVHLVLAGRAGTASAALLARVAELGAADRVHVLGHRDDVARLHLASDVFAFPSLYEGLGGAVVEALALGTPVVASDVPALREVLGGGAAGLLVPDGPTAWADALSGVLDHPAAALGRAAVGRARFAAEYDLDVVVARMADLYRSLASEPARV